MGYSSSPLNPRFDVMASSSSSLRPYDPVFYSAETFFKDDMFEDDVFCSDETFFKYDVFLSFRGEDTRKTFVDHLYAALDRSGICTFKDDERLEKGKTISDDLLESIENSRLFIIVFSKNYASSSWCLNELVKIMECHKKMNDQTAFPVFYDLEPSDVRKQGGPIGVSIEEHNKSTHESEVQQWREVLKAAADLSGWHLAKIADGHEAKVIKLIVDEVSSKLRPMKMEVDEDLIGMKRRMKDLDPYLDIGLDDVRMIGIKGMGGIGKTTLARALYDKISINYDGKSFVENVRERASKSGLEKLQKQILRDVLMDKGVTVTGVHEGKNLMKKKLRDKKVLIVLDDVDQEDHLDHLAGDLSWFKSGSRIIITTRDATVLNEFRVRWIYDVNLLTTREAIRLFSRHAFRRDNPIQEYERQSREAVDYAAGLPLTIKVLGSLFRGKSELEWKDALARLKTIPPQKTLEILEVSYEGLEDDYKEIFLDVACILRDWQKEIAIRALESSGFHAINGLRVLEQKSLITVKEGKGPRDGLYIRMHDNIADMGMNIVRREHPDEPNKHSRLWDQEKIKHVLAIDSVTEAVRCIHLKITPDIVLNDFRNLKKLRCLIMSYPEDKCSYEIVDVKEILSYPCERVEVEEIPKHFPNSLQYLYLHKYPHQCLPGTFGADNLVGLEMSGNNIKQLWKGGNVLKKLKFLYLYSTKLGSLNLGLMPNLERLHLEYNLDLVKLHMHGECGKSLVYLGLQACPSLKFFSIIPKLESLEVLRLSTQSILKVFSRGKGFHSFELRLSEKDIEESICSLQNLKTLHLNGICHFETLPETIGQLKSLEELDLSSSHELKDIPSNICRLRRLKKLTLQNCSRLEKLPDKLKDLGCLEELNIKYTGITHLPPGLSLLKGLKIYKFGSKVDRVNEFEKLAIQGFQNLRTLIIRYPRLIELHDIICMLKHLKKLKLGDKGFVELPEALGQLECLEELKLRDTKVKHLPDSICMLKLLKKLFLRGYGIAELPEALGQLECLEELVLSSTKVEHLPDSICMLKHLKNLKLICGGMEKLPEAFRQLVCMEELDLSYAKVEYLPDSICMLKHLKILKLGHCRIEQVPETLGQLECLEELDLSFTEVKHLPDSICMLKHLKILKLGHCRIEQVPEALGQLECLEELDLSFTEVKHLPDSISMLKHLKILKLGHCHIEEVPEALEQLQCLEELDLSSTDVKHLPDGICKLKCVKKLFLNRCVYLEKLPDDVGRLESLEELDLSRCYSIREIPIGICMLKHLKRLILEDCFFLEKLPEDIGQLESLENLNLSRCYRIREIPDSIQMFKCLISLNLENCRMLEKFPERPKISKR